MIPNKTRKKRGMLKIKYEIWGNLKKDSHGTYIE